ncbi:HesB/YadR/YfhF family protein [Bacillus marinisedimentorum]|uniref:HesB/YadR/YfhF family protein n=1 Tax=Bacillus marinisedimentorum TaxID=1821260 RepID=UPI000873178A|nr:hypothetical protein [Bacillus marinisedimentorum]
MKKLTVTEEAADWFISELGLEQGDYVRFVVKIYGGIPTVHPGYYLGLATGKEGTVTIKDEVKGITFYFSEQDAWLLEEHDLHIKNTEQGLEYEFNEQGP